MTDFVLLTCEHGGNRVPAAYVPLFRPHGELLSSHRGWDPGSLELARACARRLGAPLHFATVTRLLVELNRSLRHPALFSVVSKTLSAAERKTVLDTHYFPHRQKIEAEIERVVAAGNRAVHISMHTFTPDLDGDVRRADVGLLYDPKRPGEVAFCAAIKRALVALRPDLVVRMNYPYFGKADGLTTSLRKRWKSTQYVGIEIEVNQKWTLADRPVWRRLTRDLALSIEQGLQQSPRSQPDKRR